ncbi:MAG: rRNA-processing protein las1 [Sporothrix thermara]
MVQYVFTPWRDRHELLAVRRQFYPNGDGETRAASPDREAAVQAAQHAAVARVAVWMQRGYCPHMVESTALLMAAILSDEGVVSCAGGLSSSTLPTSLGSSAAYAARASYAAAFSRFVTGLLDGQQDRARKLSMHGLAQTVGLPPGFVELRHQATHEALPALRRLRVASRQALAWIWGYYWANMEEEEEEGLDGGPEAAKAAGAADEAKATMGDAGPKNEKSDDTALRTALIEHIARDDGESLIPDSLVERWGEARLLAALSAISTEEDAGDGVAGGRALRCIRLSRKLLQRKEQKAASASTASTANTASTASLTASQPRTTRTRASRAASRSEQKTAASATASESTAKTLESSSKPWTMATLNLDAMRAAMAQSRQALYQPEEDDNKVEAQATMEGAEEVKQEDEEKDGQPKENPDEDGAEADEETDGDVAMAEDAAPETSVVEPESRLPASQPRWSRYAGEWTPRPIGVV